MSLNLEKQLCFYRAYHSNQININIHMICVPLIFATSLLLAAYSPTIVVLPDWLTIPYLDLHLGTIGAILYCGFYILLEPVVGAITVPMIFGWVAYARHLTTSDSASAVVKNSLAIFVVSWIAQFVGHGFYERRAPALRDNLVQALALAPFFVFLEVLFLFGYRPELNRRVQEATDKELKKLRAEKGSAGTKS